MTPISSFAAVSFLLLTFFTACTSHPPLSGEALRNAEYKLKHAGTIRFTDGIFLRGETDSLSPLRIAMVDLFAFGDLNGDGLPDGVSVLSTRTGGPEIFLSLEAFVNTPEGASHVGSYLMGDRIAIDSIAIKNNLIHLHLVTQGPGDAMCCPTLRVQKVLSLDNGMVTERH